MSQQRKYLFALMAFTSLSMAHGAQAQNFDVKSSLIIDGEMLQSNKGANSTLDTMIGSAVVTDRSEADASAHIGGNVNISNLASDAVLLTKVGSVATKNPEMRNAITSVDGKFKADAVIERNLIIGNAGKNSTVLTDIGAVDGLVNSASAAAHVKGSVIHQNYGDRSASVLAVGSVRGPQNLYDTAPGVPR